MEYKFWDPENKYGAGDLKEYEHWLLAVHCHQSTLGSYIIIAKREGVERITELTIEELLELQAVMKEMEDVLEAIDAFKPDRFNYEQLGNALHQLHFHGFPRYKEPRSFAGQTWVDEAWGTVPIWKMQDLPDELIVQVRDAIKPHLS